MGYSQISSIRLKSTYGIDRGDEECRTISIDQNTFETIPEDIIIRAGLLAAEKLLAG